MSIVKKDKNVNTFLSLVRAGLWETSVKLLFFDEIDFEEIFRLAEEQSVLGLVTSGLERVKEATVPKDVVLRFVGSTLQIEHRNLSMNEFLANLFEEIENEGIHAILVKGQGIAQCYERPLWRSVGDIDLLLYEKDYYRAFQLLSKKADRIDNEQKYNLHQSLFISNYEVELHGSLRGGVWSNIDKTVDDVQKDVFLKQNVRYWFNEKKIIPLPSVNNDIVFIFAHILQHLYKGGVGLRQICDLCRLLWFGFNQCNEGLLYDRIRKMGALSEWYILGSFSFYYLGYPKEKFPLYKDLLGWRFRISCLLSFILETGNFGHNRDYSYYVTHTYIVRKVISFIRHTIDSFKLFIISPRGASKSWCSMINTGIKAIIRLK